MNNEQLLEQFDHFVDSHHGIYSAQVFTEKLNFEQVKGISKEDWQILLDGPKDDNSEYFDVWSELLETLVVLDDAGKRYLVWENEGIFLYPEEIHDLVNWDELSF